MFSLLFLSRSRSISIMSFLMFRYTYLPNTNTQRFARLMVYTAVNIVHCLPRQHKLYLSPSRQGTDPLHPKTQLHCSIIVETRSKIFFSDIPIIISITSQYIRSQQKTHMNANIHPSTITKTQPKKRHKIYAENSAKQTIPTNMQTEIAYMP